MPLFLAANLCLFAILGRIGIQFYYTKDLGVRLLKPSAPLSEIVAGCTFVCAFILSLVLIALNSDGLFTINISLPLWLMWVGVSAGLVGILITIIAQIQMGRSWRIGVDTNEETSLITTGLYFRSRNPTYLGIALYWLGICITFTHPLMWACAIVCWLSIEFIVRKMEEPYLLNCHGQKFADYINKTNRYLL
jgi:protein-S-isoprenylcysteine O-methyltransferase Ste14